MQELLNKVICGDLKSLARAITLVENHLPGSGEILTSLPGSNIPVIGVTGPPGAGKSTLIDSLIQEIVSSGKKVGVLCVDPSSPFNYGALLGDRIRMSAWYNHPSVFIRSLATRGSLGGLHPAIIEVTDLMKNACFDYIIVETVGVGQSEVEIGGLADITVVVLVPEGGDEIQTMKAGLMEIADIFVVNKADRPGVDSMINNLRHMSTPSATDKHTEIPILKTIATQQQGVPELLATLHKLVESMAINEKKIWLLAEKAFLLIQQKRMAELNRSHLYEVIKKEYHSNEFNLFRFIAKEDWSTIL